MYGALEASFIQYSNLFECLVSSPVYPAGVSKMIWLSVACFASEAFPYLVQTPGPGRRNARDLDGPSESLLSQLQRDCDVRLSTFQN